jgi:hypothetical protein
MSPPVPEMANMRSAPYFSEVLGNFEASKNDGGA